MGQCNSTESIQAQPAAAGPVSPRHAARGPIVNVPAEQPASSPLQPLSTTQPPARKVKETDQHAPEHSATPQHRSAGGGMPSDMSVSRSPQSILKVGGGKKHLPTLSHTSLEQGGAHFSPTLDHPAAETASPKLRVEGSSSESGCDRSSKAKVRLALPEMNKPMLEATPAQAPPTSRRSFDHSSGWVIKETEDVNNFYIFGKVLGQGQFGTTRLVTERTSGDQYACKTISKKRLKRQEEVDDVKREVQILHHLAGHPNVVCIKDVYEDRRNVHIVMELASGGELFERMSKKGRYSEKDAAAVFRKMAAVVVHCHNMGVMHRDLKPENFLLMSHEQDAQIKATDFGLSTFFREGQMFTEIVGSALYVAPEVLKRQYSKEADVWSLGVILYILLCGTPPFMAETEEKVFRKVLRSVPDMRSKPWPLISEDAKDCVRSMLERDPKKRATAQQILSHPWVKENGVASDQPLQFEVLTRLQGFSAMNNMKKQAVKIIASLMPENEIMGLREIFKSIDTDNSGAITIAELREGLLRKGTIIPEEQLAQLMQFVDINGNGNLDYDEFIAATLNQSKIEQDAYLLQAFREFDKDDSGFITQDELMQALLKDNVPLAEINAILAQVDRNGDGSIDYEEFCIMMTQGDPPATSSAAGPASNATVNGVARQSLDYVRPSWSTHGGSRGEHLLAVTPEMHVSVQRHSLMRAMSRKRRTSHGDSLGSTNFRHDRGDSGAPSLATHSENEQEEGNPVQV